MTESSRADAADTPTAEARELDGLDAPETAVASAGVKGRMERVRAACRFLMRPEHLRRTGAIALVVGLVLTAINQLDVIIAGDATTATWVKCGLNFVVPFCVANLGLLSGMNDSDDGP